MIMTTLWTTPLLLVVACAILIHSNSIINAADGADAAACSVVKDGIDMTETFAITDPEMPDVLTVNCTGAAVCKEAMIDNCPRVLCHGKAACYGASINDFTLEVLCSGPHACQRTHMVASSLQEATTSIEQEFQFQRNVVCLGVGSCDVATIDYNGGQAMDVYCIGSKSCRRAQLTVGDGMVTCRQSAEKTSQYMACMGNTRIQAKCLQCQESGCKPYINECLYRSSVEADAHKCEEGSMGDCPSEISDINNELASSAEEQDEEEGTITSGTVEQGEIKSEQVEQQDEP